MMLNLAFPVKTMGITCTICSAGYSVQVYQKDYEAWRNGLPVQDAFPYLSADQRELLISKICGTCYDKLCDEMEN